MKLLPLALFSIALGLLTSVLAAFIFLIWFDAWWKRHEIDAHLSAAMPSPAVRCDGGMEGKAEQAFEKPALEPVELPKQFEDWWNKKNEEMS